VNLGAPFDVLIHAPLYGVLRSLPPQPRSGFRRLIDRLRAGHWGGGARVKKLRGSAKPVFEARHDAGDRVLFTFGHTAARDGSAILRPHLMLWDLVTHDRVSGRARRLNPSAEAEFLDWEEMESEEVGAPPPHPAASFDEVAGEAGAGVVELMLAPEDAAPRPREEITGGVRWYVLPDRLLVDEASWQALIDHGADELELKLTAEQYRVVRAPGPVLLSGSAGSGKTTIAVHRLAAATGTATPGRVLYVTYSGWLRDHARGLFHDLLACRGEHPARAPDFLTVHELYRMLVGEGAGARATAPVDYAEFSRWYEGQFRRTDAALAWEEIRGIVKGANLDPARPLLPRDEYEALGRKRAPAFAGERPRLHHVARRWQEHLEAGGRVDEIDLCRLALAAVPAGGRYEHLICDEAQDLAELQMELLLRLVAGPSLTGLFLAGDPQQVINPSGFRWAEVRSRVRERFLDWGRPAPELHALTRNFRSVRGIVELANEVLAFKRDRTGRSDGDLAEESVVAGAAPILVAGEESDLADAIRGFGPRCAVVAGSADLRERLQAALGTTRVFTVPEAKGLEFDVAILWGVVAADPEPWRRLLDPGAVLREDPSARRALHHLYVAVTRARRHLAIHEPDEAPPLWSAERFAARLDREPPASLTRLFVSSATPEEWAREGVYFLERGRYRQAAECFRRGGDARREAESLARHHEAAGEPALAAERWRALGETAAAARCFEAAGQWAEAAADWARLADQAGEGRCRARLAEADRRWADAAARWEDLQAWEDAARCWSNAGQRNHQVRCLAMAAESAGQWAVAARRWEELEEWNRAAAGWQAAGRDREAWIARARDHEAGRRWAEAAAAWERSGDGTRASRCQAESAAMDGRWEDAARAWEGAGEYQRAMRAWQQAGRPDQSQRCAVRRDMAESRFARAAEALEDLGEFAEAAEAWARAETAGQTPTSSRSLPLPGAATKRWGAEGKPARLARGARPSRMSARRRPPLPAARLRALVCAARAAEDGGRFDRAAVQWKSLGDTEQALRCRVAHLDGSGAGAEAARALESAQRFADAAERWSRAGREDDAARCLAEHEERQGDLDAAARAWDALGQPRRAARCRGHLFMRQGLYEQAALAYEAAGEPGPASTARALADRVKGVAASGGAREAAGHAYRETTTPGTRGSIEPVARRVRAPGGPAAVTGRTPAPAELSRAIVDAVRRSPGLTCEDIAYAVGTTTAQVKPLLAAHVGAGRLRKVGRTRGTRYHLA